MKSDKQMSKVYGHPKILRVGLFNLQSQYFLHLKVFLIKTTQKMY